MSTQLHNPEKLSPAQRAQAESLVTNGATGSPIMQASARAAINTLKAKVDEQQGAILCQSHSSRPDGVSLLDSMTHSYEAATGRKSTIPPAVVSKLEAQQKLASLRAEAREVKSSIRPTAPAKRTARDFLALDAAGTKQLIITGCSIARGEDIRHEIRSLFEGMDAGADRTAFYQKFRSILTFR
jgi:hypothetical protein